jgi:hypothetical protein
VRSTENIVRGKVRSTENINWCQYNERLNSKTEGSEHLVYTGLFG